MSGFDNGGGRAGKEAAGMKFHAKGVLCADAGLFYDSCVAVVYLHHMRPKYVAALEKLQHDLGIAPFFGPNALKTWTVTLLEHPQPDSSKAVRGVKF